MPIFFLISSILLYKKEFCWLSNVRRKIRTLMIPYIICNSFWIVIFLILQNISLTSVFFTSKDNLILNWSTIEWFNRYFYFNIADSKLMYPFLFPLWFIRDLFIMNIFAPVIKVIIDKTNILLLPIILICYCLHIWIPNEYNYIYLNMQSVVFFSLGYYFVKYNVVFEKINKLNTNIISSIYIMLLAIGIILFIYHIEFRVVFYLTILTGIIFWIKISSIIVENKIKDKVLYLSKSIMMVYLFHEFTLTMIRKVLTKLLPQTISIQFFEYICAVLLTIFLTILLDKILKHYAEGVYLLITGDRK